MAKYDFTNEEPFKELTQAESDNIAYEQGYHDAVVKAAEWLTERTAFGVHPCSGTALVMEFKKFMEG